MGRGLDDGWRRVGGWTVAVAGLAALVSVPLSLSGGVYDRADVVTGPPDAWVALFIPGYLLSGAVLVHLRPRNPIGWLLVVSGFLQVTNLAADTYATRALTDPDGSLPLGVPLAWLASWTWMPSLLLPALVLPPLYPTGRAPNRYWSLHVRLALVGIAMGVGAMATGQGGLDDTVVGTELPWTAPAWTTYVLGLGAAALLVPAALSAVVGTVIRAIRAVTPERQQLLLLISVVTGMLATVFTGPELLFVLSYTLIPVAVTVGVLRYRLLGIEVALQRTLFYLPLTLLVALVVGLLTTTLARLTPDGILPLLVASAVVAVLVLPLAARLQVLVDRFVRGDRADPLALVNRVGAGLEAEHDDPIAAMLDAVASATGAVYASVRDPDERLLARLGAPHASTVDLPLRHGGTTFGTLSVGPRRGERTLSDEDTRLVTALAPQLAVVVRSQRLTEELARERRRVTAATLAERDRVRRDLHDGLGPSLSGIALGLEAASAMQRDHPAAVPEVLRRTREEADAAVREIRRVLDGLRPSALDLHGFEDAVRVTAHSLGMGDPGGPSFELVTDRLPPLPPLVEETAFKILAESLTNVARHSAARRCDVRLVQADGHLCLRVSDDGRGPGNGSGAGHGLDSMRRRAADVGGALSVTGAEPHGTVVDAVLPVELR